MFIEKIFLIYNVLAIIIPDTYIKNDGFSGGFSEVL